ncbi:MAG TPA: tetratricopeptide repeat protein, partial [Burkholderiales bacterium]
MKRIALTVLVLAGCAVGTPEPEMPGPEAPPAPEAPLEAVPLPPAPPAQAEAPRESVAIAGLVQRARADAAAGRLANAAAALERALRIEPRNPRLWQELARVRLRQGEYLQAESLAQRSNTWGGADNRLRAENWGLIAQARQARGDTEGARKA